MMKIIIDDQQLIGKKIDKLPGGNQVLPAADMEGTDYWNQGLGQYAAWPGMSPKYHTGADRLAAANHMAKLFVQINPKIQDIIIDTFGDESAITVLRKCGYIDFLLTSITEEFEEKLQVVTLNGDNYAAYYFGRKPPVFQYTGVVYNTWQDDWRIKLLLLYDKLLRGSKLAQLNSYVKLYYDTAIIIGSLPNLRVEMQANTETGANFAFSLLVKEYILLQKPINPPFLLPEDSCYPSLSDTQTVDSPQIRTTKTVNVRPPKIKKGKGTKKIEEEKPFNKYDAGIKPSIITQGDTGAESISSSVADPKITAIVSGSTNTPLKDTKVPGNI